MPNAFGAMIEALLPKSLDDIVRRNREHFEVREATDLEIFNLYMEIEPNIPKYVLTDWTIVTFNLKQVGIKSSLLVGDREIDGKAMRTSGIVGIDQDRGLVRTQSGSLYQITKKSKVEPNFDQLALICHHLHMSGVGEVFGVPHFFY